MTTQHTQGRLKLGRVSHSEQSAEIDAESNTAWMDAYPWEGLAECRGCDENKTRGAAVMEANARRLVACWNACEGIPTPDLEVDNVLFTGMLRERSTLKNQRDELLAALGSVLSLVDRDAPQLSGKVIGAARAAIAKAEGSAK